MVAISGRRTIQVIAAAAATHLIQLSQWKRCLLDGANELFSWGQQCKDKEASQASDAELFQKNGKLQMELEWQKKSQLL